MFLWVRLVLINLKACYNIGELEEAATSLPDGLDQA
jgi:hypothetical protein